MKHPVDTSTWGKFKVGELFDDIGRGTRIKKQDRVIGETPLVTAGYENQGVAEYIKENKELFQGPLLTIDMFGNAFARDYDFYADDNILVFKSSKYSFKSLLFIASALTYLQTQYDYTNQFRQQSVPKTTVKLPLKQGTNLVDYTQEDIDWDYMESFMSRVQEAATERLANLPETGQKSKTPVDVNKWGEFDVIALFDIINTKSIRQSDVQAQLLSNNGSTPYITASDKNNAILAYIECPQEWIDEGNCIFIGGKTTTITYQQKDFCSNDSHNLALYLKHKQARTKHIQLYLVSIFKKTFAKYHWGDALSKTKIKTESIKLPLKSSADPSNYTQDDIDWDYMESFMEQFHNLAKNRVERLTSAHDCDILTV